MMRNFSHIIIQADRILHTADEPKILMFLFYLYKNYAHLIYEYPVRRLSFLPIFGTNKVDRKCGQFGNVC